MTSENLEFNQIIKNLKEQIQYLKDVKSEFYQDDRGGQLHNALCEIAKMNYKVQSKSLRTVMDYEQTDCIDTDIKRLEGLLLTFEKYAAN